MTQSRVGRDMIRWKIAFCSRFDFIYPFARMEFIERRF